jgi:hypothetical protein
LTLTLPALVFIAVDTALSRHMWEVRARYPEKSVAELVNIASHGNDPFAVNALGAKGEDAVPGLRDLLLDESSPGIVRHVAAHSLGGIGFSGVSSAVMALEEARTRTRDTDLLQAIDYALESARRSDPP